MFFFYSGVNYSTILNWAGTAAGNTETGTFSQTGVNSWPSDMYFTIQVKGVNMKCTFNFNGKYEATEYNLCSSEGRTIQMQGSNRRAYTTYSNMPNIRNSGETSFDVNYSCLIAEVEDTVGSGNMADLECSSTWS